jgi:PTH1 family peptidyl-tRNA hydrolase
VKLICGLGNPGREYERHRHNVGFMVVAALLSRAGASLDQRKFQGRVGQGMLGRERILFVEPETYMNLSGYAFAQAASFYKISPEDCLVVHDDVDFPFGRIQLKIGGGAGGHNGIKSILACTGDDRFVRLRFGIGKPEGPNPKDRVVGHVLSGFSPDEQAALKELISKAADAAECWVREGLAVAMNRFNKREKPPKEDAE